MAESPKVLITDHPWSGLEIERGILETIGAEVVEPLDPGPEAIAAVLPSVDAIGVCWAPLPAELLDRCHKCRIIARFGIGLDNIPVEAATRAGIPVTYVPDYCIEEVADHTLALILGLLRDIPAFDRSLKSGVYDPNRFMPKRLRGITLGVVGYGRIGRAVAERARAFGMRCLVTTRTGSAAGIPAVPLDELLATADVVSLHLPLTPETSRLLDEARLALMKPSAYLVNTSRGGLIDSGALVSALDAGQLAGAAVDVFEVEPTAPHDPVVSHPNVIATPHVAFRSEEAVVELRTRAARQIADALAGRRPEHVVNPEVFEPRC